MKKNYLLSLTLFIAFFCTSRLAYSQNTYTNTTFGFSIDFPAGWAQKTSSVEHTIIKASNSTSTVITYMTIAGYPVSVDEGNSINTAVASKAFSLVKTKFGMETMTLEKTGDATMGGIAMHWCTLNFNMMGKTAHCKTYFFAKNENLFRLTYCCDGTTTHFNDGLKLFETSVGSFKLN